MTIDLFDANLTADVPDCLISQLINLYFQGLNLIEQILVVRLQAIVLFPDILMLLFPKWYLAIVNYSAAFL